MTEPCDLTAADIRAARSAAVIAASIYYVSDGTDADSDDVIALADDFAKYVLTGKW